VTLFVPAAIRMYIISARVDLVGHVSNMSHFTKEPGKGQPVLELLKF
jgi:hypothetical protein